VFGGAFDPPHMGHINLVKSICSKVKPDKVLIIPTGNAPHKTTQTPFETRFKLAQAAFPSYEISDIENTPEKSYTVDTLRKLHQIYPNSDFHLIVGQDMYDFFDKWKDHEQIRELCTVEAGARDSKSSTQIRGWLTEKRYTHSINVAIMCGELSKKHKLTPKESEKAYIAGILHDIMKKSKQPPHPTEFNPAPIELSEPKLWHALTGAKYVRDEMEITDLDILNAIRYHTIGRPNMSVIEKIVYIADKISAERDYKGVEYLRQLAFENLDLAVKTEIKEKEKRYERH